MNDKEVKEIYDYLHEHYRYKKGDLICIKEIKRSKKKGDKLGTIKTHPEGYTYINATFKVNEKLYSKRLAHLVYLFHHEKFPQFIWYLDENQMNTNIENLISTRIREPNAKNYFKIRDSYRVSIIIDGIQISLGSHKSEEDAQKAVYLAKSLAADTDYSPEKIKELVHKELNIPMFEKTSGLPVGVKKAKNKFRACIAMNGKRHSLGSYHTPEEAHNAYLKAKSAYDEEKKRKADEKANHETAAKVMDQYAIEKGEWAHAEICSGHRNMGTFSYPIGTEVYFFLPLVADEDQEKAPEPLDWEHEITICKGIITNIIIHSEWYYDIESLFQFAVKDISSEKEYLVTKRNLYKDFDDLMLYEVQKHLSKNKTIWEIEEIEDEFFDD